MPLVAGHKLGPYEIAAPIGAGGMGEVYRARDTRLGRTVAIKILPSQFSSDPIRKQRFEREARTVSGLNHPSICHLYDVGNHEEILYLVMEFLEGETLAERLRIGPLPLTDSLRIGIQIADGLEMAHGSGVVHRDLKPANLFLTKHGDLKILDFGLAKADSSGVSGQSIGPGDLTLTHGDGLSSPGMALGTAAYMSPEQARGEPVDARSDVFSFGIVLYEITTGRQPFTSSSAAMLFDSILHRQPQAPSSMNPSVPIALERLIQRMMAKDPAARPGRAKDVSDELRTIQQQSSSHSRPAATSTPSIAVLPFEDLSADRSQQPFCEGMAAEIITALGAVKGLRVISRTSAVRCREKGMELSEIGQHLGVQSVLEGTVRKSGSRLRVTAQLISTQDGSQTWSERYDRGEGDVFDIQDEIAAAIVKNLKGRLISGAPAVRRATDNPEAYKLYLKGRYFWERRNRSSASNAVTYFEQAIALDPDYALAHTGLADCYVLMAVYSIKPYKEVQPLARAMVERALELDPDLPEAYLSLGAVQSLLDYDWAGGEASFLRALELNPKFAVARVYRANVLTWTGRTAEARSEVNLALKDEPDSALMYYLGSLAYFHANDLDAAKRLVERALELEPTAIFALWIRGWIYCLQGKAEEIIPAMLQAVLASNHHPMLVSVLGVAYARAGRTAEAEELLLELKNRSARECIISQAIGDIYLFLGRTSEALDYLERGFDEHNSFISMMASGPQYAVLRKDPRGRALALKLNLPVD